MPDYGYYEKRPRPGSIKILLEYLSSSPVVESTSMDRQTLTVDRTGTKKSLRIHLTNIYIVSVADVIEILASDPTVDAIVTMSEWNSYSQEAESLCSERGVGLFKFREFLGAVYHDGSAFINYQAPNTDARNRYRTDTGT